jgi:hypothetical protein
VLEMARCAPLTRTPINTAQINAVRATSWGMKISASGISNQGRSPFQWS